MFAGSAYSALLPDAEAEAMAREKLARMTLEEKSSLCGLCATMYLNAIPRVGIDREWAFSDASHAMKPEHNRDRWGYVAGVDDRSTCLPCLSALAATWNRALAARHGDVMGAQMRSRDKSQMLGPGVNIMRNPLCGRNWEYLSEDPFVAAQMAVPIIQAAQAHGLACTVKHFCLNDQELNRHKSNSTADLRALHEIYLPAFEAAVKEGGVLSVMTAYNKVNGIYASENAYLQTALLREQWGFKGVIVTDWGGQHSCDFAVVNGGGIEAHNGRGVTHLTNFYGAKGKDKLPLATAVRAGRVPESVVDDMTLRILYVMAKTGFLTKSQDAGERLVESHREVARRIGEEAIVLAKNEKGVLPLDRAKTKKLVVFGQVARLKQAELGSSCECHVAYEVSFLDGLVEYLGSGCEVVYYPLGDEVGEEKKAVAEVGEKTYGVGGVAEIAAAGKERRRPLAELRGECAQADAVVVFTGTTMGRGQAKETEGGDRPNMKGAPGHDREIADILSWGLPRTVVVCRSGSAVELPWLGECETLLLTSYLGQEAGRPLPRVLFGDVNPSGKLAYSWPKRYEDTPTGHFGKSAYNADNSVYREGVYVGYRWYEKRGIAVDFPFGHGLSYTRFEYGAARVAAADGGWRVSVGVTNVGDRDGAEVVQLYVSAKAPKVDRPVKELKGFEKVFLAKGETKTVEFALTPRDFAYYDVFSAGFRTDPGEYAVLVGSSSADIRSAAEIAVGNWPAAAAPTGR